MVGDVDRTYLVRPCSFYIGVDEVSFEEGGLGSIYGSWGGVIEPGEYSSVVKAEEHVH